MQHPTNSASIATPAEARRVLIVDDYVDSAETLAEAIAYLGYETATADDAGAALALAERFKPHVALLDIQMPRMTGFELGQRLLAIRGERPPLTLIAVSGFSTANYKNAATAAGFAHYLVKPVELDDLRELLAGIFAFRAEQSTRR